MVREELQKDKLKNRVGKRAWGFEERLREGKRSRLAGICLEEMRERIEREGIVRIEDGKGEVFRGKRSGDEEMGKKKGRRGCTGR